MKAMGHQIRVVAQRTGLSPHVIRIWEKRYRVVEPSRTDTNRRRYSDEEIERLALLRQATEAGHSIGTIATLTTEQIRSVLSADRAAASTSGIPLPPPAPTHVTQALESVRRLDANGLEEVLHQAALELGHQGLLCQLISPLASAVGEHWERGELTAAHEHFATAHIKAFLNRTTRAYAWREDSPRLLVATPAGQLHELGAILVASSASNLGWNVTYLGPNLPAIEISGAARQTGSKAVALSIVYPADCSRLNEELRLLRKTLPADVPVLAGGRSAAAYAACLRELKVEIIEDLPGLWETLNRLRP